MDIQATDGKLNAFNRLVMDYNDICSDSSDNDGEHVQTKRNEVNASDGVEVMDTISNQQTCSDGVESRHNVDLEDGEIESGGEESRTNTIEDASSCCVNAPRNIVESVEEVYSETVESVSEAENDTIKDSDDVHSVIETCLNFVNSVDNGQEIVSVKAGSVFVPTLIKQSLDDSFDSSEDSEESGSSADESDDSDGAVVKNDDSDTKICPPKIACRKLRGKGVVKRAPEPTVRCTQLICEAPTEPVPLEKVEELVNAFCNYRKEEEEEEGEEEIEDGDGLGSSGSVSDIDCELVDLDPVEVEAKRKALLLKKFPRTKGELLPEDLPAIKDLQIDVGDDIKMSEVGKITSIVGVLVIVQSLQGLPPLNDDTILFSFDKKVLGKVFETFGPVALPLYSIRFNSTEHIKEHAIEIGMSVFCAPTQLEWTHYVFIEHLRRIRGCDASWENNNEPPYMFQDYSDDETEKRAITSLKHQGIRVTKTGEILAPPDWETFKKDYPSAKQARKAYQLKYRTKPLTTEKLLLTSWPPPPPPETSENPNKRPYQKTAAAAAAAGQRPVHGDRQRFSKHPNPSFNRNPGGETVTPNYRFPHPGRFPGNVPQRGFNANCAHPPGTGSFGIPPGCPTLSSANSSTCNQAYRTSMANGCNNPPALQTQGKPSMHETPKSCSSNDSNWHPISSTPSTFGSTMTSSSYAVPPPIPSQHLNHPQYLSSAFPMQPLFNVPHPPPHMRHPSMFGVPPPQMMMPPGSHAPPIHPSSMGGPPLPPTVGAPMAHLPPNIARFPLPLPFGPPRFGVPPNFGYM